MRTGGWRLMVCAAASCFVAWGEEAPGPGGPAGPVVELESSGGRKLVVTVIEIGDDAVSVLDSNGRPHRIPFGRLTEGTIERVQALQHIEPYERHALPREMRPRMLAESRLAAITAAGGPAEAEAAVVRALEFLRGSQLHDGSWGNPDRGVTGDASAMTGLALLCFLGHGESPLSEESGVSVLRGITWLVDVGMQNKGKLIPRGGEKVKHWPYEQAIGTMALAEATTLCKQLGIMIPNLRDVTLQAGQYMIDNQHQSGGWDYGYDESGARGGDLSITSWHIQALKACEQTGMQFRGLPRCIAMAIDYVGQLQHTSGGFGYVVKAPGGDTGGYFTLTGAGMLCLQLCGMENAPAVQAGADYLAKHSRFGYKTEFCDLYGHYHEAHAMHRRGGEQWLDYQRQVIPELLSHQSPGGSWPVPGNLRKPRAVAARFIGEGPQAHHYRTCLATLILECYYR